jgi:hypothetical protein
MKKKYYLYIAMALGLLLGYLPLSSWLLRTKSVNAHQVTQCVRYFLVSDVANPSCGTGNSKISQTLCSGGGGPYGTSRVIALCVGPP